DGRVVRLESGGGAKRGHGLRKIALLDHHMRQMDMGIGEVRLKAYRFPNFGRAVVTLIRKLPDDSHAKVGGCVSRIGLQDALELLHGLIKMLKLHQVSADFIM